MNKKFVVLVALAFALMLVLLLPAAYAFEQGQGCKHGKGHEKAQMWGHGKGKEQRHKGLDEKLFKKAHFMVKNKEELGLSDKQVEKIKNLKREVKKGLIMREAEIEVLAIDIEAEMMEEQINTNTINGLIDKKYEIKKAKAKSLVEAYAQLKEVLTKEQKGKLKDLWKSCKTEGKEQE